MGDGLRFLDDGRDALPGADVRLGTRVGTYADSAQTVAEAEELLGPMAHMKQVHGAEVRLVDAPGLVVGCDALVTERTDLWLAVKTADCVPVLFSSPVCVAVAHAGWRGLEQGVLAATVRVMQDTFGVEVGDVNALVGPCISGACYEVEEHFSGMFGAKFVLPGVREGKAFLDVRAVANDQLKSLGIADARVAHVDRCTFSAPETFNSYRRFSLFGNEDYGVQISCVRRKV